MSIYNITAPTDSQTLKKIKKIYFATSYLNISQYTNFTDGTTVVSIDAGMTTIAGADHVVAHLRVQLIEEHQRRELGSAQR